VLGVLALAILMVVLLAAMGGLQGR
jgi:hypothetical protein